MERPKKQTTRQLKVVCVRGTKYKLRGSREILDMGLPKCPCCDLVMVEDVVVGEEDGDDSDGETP